MPDLFRRRINLTLHTPDQIQRLEEYNHLVGLYLWIGLSCIITIPSIANVVLVLQGYKARREAGAMKRSKRLPPVKSMDPGERQVSIRFSESPGKAKHGLMS